MPPSSPSPASSSSARGSTGSRRSAATRRSACWRAGPRLPRGVARSLFYTRRLPDALTGPFVEVATVFARSRAIGLAATIAVASGRLGHSRPGPGASSAMSPRRRLAGLVPLVTLPVLPIWPFTEAGRFLIPLVPCLLVGMVEALAWFLRLILRPTRHPHPPPQGGGVVVPLVEGNLPPSPLRGGGRGPAGFAGRIKYPRRLASSFPSRPPSPRSVSLPMRPPRRVLRPSDDPTPISTPPAPGSPARPDEQARS